MKGIDNIVQGMERELVELLYRDTRYSLVVAGQLYILSVPVECTSEDCWVDLDTLPLHNSPRRPVAYTSAPSCLVEAVVECRRQFPLRIHVSWSEGRLMDLGILGWLESASRCRRLGPALRDRCPWVVEIAVEGIRELSLEDSH
jgi:hypothetical protein